MKALKLFFIVSVLTSNLFSQAPGYLGKRLSVGYGFYASPGFIGSRGHTPINMLHEGSVEFAAKKRLSIGFSARFYKAIYGNGRQVHVTSGYSSLYDQIDDHPRGTTDISGRNYMLYFKLFSKNYVAPWGRYFTFGATINTFTSRYDPTNMYVLTQQYQNYPVSGYVYSRYTSFGTREQSFTKFDLMLGFGRSRIIAKRVILDYGYNINVLALSLTLFDAPDDNFLSENYLSPSEYIEKTSASRVRGVNRFNVFVKVGFLLF